MDVICPYCDKPSRLVTGRKVYPKRTDLYYLYFWICEPCGAYVGCHKRSKAHKPLGRLANKELRFWKMQAHQAFDPFWGLGNISRTSAYSWLANQMGLTSKQCHIGWFTVDQCKKVKSLCDSQVPWWSK